MAKDVASILSEMRSNPAGVRRADACKVVTHYFGEPRQSGASHNVWKMPWHRPRLRCRVAAPSDLLSAGESIRSVVLM